jgi:hypothetical protein
VLLIGNDNLSRESGYQDEAQDSVSPAMISKPFISTGGEEFKPGTSVPTMFLYQASTFE